VRDRPWRAADRLPGGVRAGNRRGRRDHHRRRQYPRLHPHDDDGDRAGNQQRRSRARARPRDDPDPAQHNGERGGVPAEQLGGGGTVIRVREPANGQRAIGASRCSLRLPIAGYCVLFAVSASGKNSCSPPILYSAMVRWPSGEMSQSTNACPSATFTSGCFAGLTSITPYWLNSRRSPCTRIDSSPRLRNETHVPRSDSRSALAAAAMLSAAPMPWPISRYQPPFAWSMSMPASFQYRSSAAWVPDRSPREMNGALAAAMLRNASSRSRPPSTRAGSLLGPITTKSLYMTSKRFTPKPSARNFSSAALS